MAQTLFELGFYCVPVDVLCFDNEKGDALLRIGLCHRQLGNIPAAQEYLTQAVAYYRRFNDQYKLIQVEREMKRLNGE